MPLIIGPNERVKIAELRAFAAAMPLQVARIQALAAADIEGFRSMMQTMSIVLPVGYEVCYSHEIQPQAPVTERLCHHISITSEHDDTKVPNLEAVRYILQMFGMGPPEQSLGIWLEHVTPEIKALNVIQLVA